MIQNAGCRRLHRACLRLELKHTLFGLLYHNIQNLINCLQMKLSSIPFAITDWSTIRPTEYHGERGTAYWRTKRFGQIRVRMVEYSPGYLADHWCVKGHILLCLSGELETELKDGRRCTLTPGMSYQVADDEPHRSSTTIGTKLFIVD